MKGFQNKLASASNVLALLISVTLIVYSLVQREQRESISKTDFSNSSNNQNLKYGNPSQANTNDLNNLLITKQQYTLSYNCSKGIPNWSSWHLDSSWMGNIDRTEYFRADEELPNNCQKIVRKDYTGSGYDRGHLTPSADRNATIRDNKATFLMSNMIPQSKASNREVWRELEEYCRELAEINKNLYQVAGWSGIDGEIKRKVTIPRYLWKVVLIEEDMTAIAVLIPNNKTVKNTDWEDYITTVDKIEEITGYDFFSNLEDSIESKIERRVYWQ